MPTEARLTGVQRRALKNVVSDRVRELRPYLGPNQEVVRRRASSERDSVEAAPPRVSGLDPEEARLRQEEFIRTVNERREGRHGGGRPPLAFADDLTEQVPEVLNGSDPLSSRERQVAALIPDGLTNTEIAERIRLKPDTVRGVLQRACHKTGARNRAHLAALVVRGQLDVIVDDSRHSLRAAIEGATS